MMRRSILRWFFILACVVGADRSHTAETVTYAYDKAGRLSSVNYGNGKRVTYAYDPAGNLIRKAVVVFSDVDNDFIDDAWEQQYFMTLSRDGTGDFDGDGQSDLAEFLASTDPTSTNSVLKVIRGPEVANGGARIEWSAVAGKRYRVQYKDKVDDPAWNELIGDVVANGPTAEKVDGTAGVSSARYYRVATVP